MFIDDTQGGKGMHLKYRAATMGSFVRSAARLLAMPAARLSRVPDAQLRAVALAIRWLRQSSREVLGGKPWSEVRVAVFGTQEPTYESLVVASGAASVTTIEYQPLTLEHPRVSTITVTEAMQKCGWVGNPGRGLDSETDPRTPPLPPCADPALQFDVALAISSFDHDGLGRYGESLAPDGDLLAMEMARAMLLTADGGTPRSALVLSVPVGQDRVVFNTGRIYGRLRLPRLLRGWTVLQRELWDEARLDDPHSARPTAPRYKPALVLQPAAPGGAGHQLGGEL